MRLRHDHRDRSQFSVAEFIAELAPAAALEADARRISLNIEAGDSAACVDADRPVLAAVVVNLLQNAFKFTRPCTTVTLRGSATRDRVMIEVEDECGGFPDGKTDDLFRPFAQQSADRTGVGLGLAMCRWGAEVNTVTFRRATCRVTGACLRSLFSACRLTPRAPSPRSMTALLWHDDHSGFNRSELPRPQPAKRRGPLPRVW